MRKYLVVVLFLFIAQLSQAQKMVVTVNPTSAVLFEECIPVGNKKKVNLKTSTNGVLAVQEGYATVGYSFGDLAKIGGETFNIELEEVTPLPEGFNSKTIEFKKITDTSGEVEKPARMGLYGVQIAGTELNTPVFMNPVCETFTDYGYSLLNADNMFEDSDDTKTADIIVIGDIRYFSKGTAGPKYQVSLIVEWSVYDVATKKVVMTLITGGYSDKQQQVFNSELVSALQDAQVGLMINPEFQAIVGN